MNQTPTFHPDDQSDRSYELDRRYKFDTSGYGLVAIGLGLMATSSYELAQQANIHNSLLGIACGIGLSAVGARRLQNSK